MNKGLSRRNRHSAKASGGFTLVEMLVAMLVLLMVLGGALSIFSFASKLARAQLHVAGAQQSSRISQDFMVRSARMAGRGGLPRGLMPAGVAMAVRNDVPATGDLHHIAVGDSDSPEVVEGTDVLTLRGVISTPLYQLATGGVDMVLNDPTAPTSGILTVRAKNPRTELPQDITPFQDLIDNETPVPLVIVSPVDSRIYAVVEFNYSGPNTSVTDTEAVLDFSITGGTYADDYLAMSPNGAFPGGLRTGASVGILEEIRYYIRQDYVVPGDDTSDPMPRLSQAQFYPGTEVALGGDAANLQLDVADNVVDLQVAIGIDLNGDQVLLEDGSEDDDWLFNSEDDDPTDNKWNIGPGGDAPPLYYLRISSLARTDRPDLNYVDDPQADIEDHIYDETGAPADEDERRERMYRRRFSQSVVDLRNIL